MCISILPSFPLRLFGPNHLKLFNFYGKYSFRGTAEDKLDGLAITLPSSLDTRPQPRP